MSADFFAFSLLRLAIVRDCVSGFALPRCDVGAVVNVDDGFVDVVNEELGRDFAGAFVTVDCD